MPKEFVIVLSCFPCRTKGLTLADARCLSLNNCEVEFSIKKGMVHILATIQIRLDQYLGISMRWFVMEGMLEGEWEDLLLLPIIVLLMVPPFLSPVFLLQTHFPNILCSTKRSLIVHLLFDFLCAQSATFFLIA